MILRIIQVKGMLMVLTFIKIFAIIICNLPRDDHNDHNFPGCLYFNGPPGLSGPPSPPQLPGVRSTRSKVAEIEPLPLFWNSSSLNLLKTVTIVLMSIITIILIIEYNHEHNHHHLQRMYSYIEVVSLTPHLSKREANLESHSAQNYIYERHNIAQYVQWTVYSAQNYI